MKKQCLYYAIVFCVFTLSACSKPIPNGTTEANTEGDNEAPVIALVMKSLANEFFVNMAEQAQQHATENSETYTLVVNGTKNESDLAQQVALIDQMVASGVDAIVLAPADSKAIVPAIVRALNAGVAVINIDNQLDKETLESYDISVPFVGPDNKQGAFMVAKHAAETLSANANVLILEGIPSAFNSQQRKAGFLQAVEEHQLNLLEVQSADWEQTKAAQITSSLLIQHPQTHAIFAANDNMALGALVAVKRANLSPAPTIVGFDNIQAIQPHIQSGDILATVDQFGGQLAIFGIEKALATLNGERLDSVTQTPLELVSSGNQ